MHERISVNQLCFPGADLSQLEANWRALNPQRISFVSPTLMVDDLAPVQALIQRGGYRVETIPHMFLLGQALSGDPASWALPRQSLSRLIDAAQTIGARSIYMLTGGRGSMSWEQAAEAFSAAIAPCVEHAREAGIALMIENALPLYADLHIAHSLRDTITLAEMAGIGICMDVYGCWTEADLPALVRRAMPRCHVIQVSDYVYGDRALPGRAVPGDGAIPLAQLLDYALAAGFSGPFDLELIGPRIDREGHVPAAARAAERLSGILNTLGA